MDELPDHYPTPPGRCLINYPYPPGAYCRESYPYPPTGYPPLPLSLRRPCVSPHRADPGIACRGTGGTRAGPATRLAQTRSRRCSIHPAPPDGGTGYNEC